MDKRDLGNLVRDANWKKLNEVIDNQSETKARSTIKRLIDVFAEARINDYTRGFNFGVGIYPDEIHVLVLLENGRYIESMCIKETYHIKRYIQKIIPSVSDEEVDAAKSVLYKEGRWLKDSLELRLEHHRLYSA